MFVSLRAFCMGCAAGLFEPGLVQVDDFAER